MTHGNLTLGSDARTVLWEGRTLALTPSEFLLPETLLRRADRVLTHDAPIERVHPSEHEVSRNALEAHVSTLRRKLRAVGVPPLIDTRRGFGCVVSSAPAVGTGSEPSVHSSST